MDIDQQTERQTNEQVELPHSSHEIFTPVVSTHRYRSTGETYCLGHFTCPIKALKAMICYICNKHCYNEDQLYEYQLKHDLDRKSRRTSEAAMLHFCMAVRKEIGDDPATILSEIEDNFCDHEGEDPTYTKYTFNIFSGEVNSEIDELAAEVILL